MSETTSSEDGGRRRQRRADRHRRRKARHEKRRARRAGSGDGASGHALDTALRSSSRGADPRKTLRAWLLLFDGLLKGLESTVWELRGVADQTIAAFDSAGYHWDDVSGFSSGAKSWKSRHTRLATSGWMLAKVVGSYRWLNLRMAFVSKEHGQRLVAEAHAVNARRFYETSLEQGGAFLKVGQLMSARPDILPDAWVHELSKLQDAAKPVAFEAVRDVIEADFEGPLEEQFAELDPEPIAAASIGQVHRATTKDGVEVAVKVKRPGIDELVEVDMSLLDSFVEAIKSMLPPGDYRPVTAEVREMILGELDYRAEAQSMKTVQAKLSNQEGVRVPRLVEGLCSDNVLTSTFEEGRKITDWLDERVARGDDEAHAELSDVLGKLLEVYLIQVLRDGMFQADPHPGNFLVADDGTLVLLDFGCTKTLRPNIREGFGDLMRAFMVGDQDALAQAFAGLGFETASGSPDTLRAFAEALLRRFKEALQTGNVTWPTREEIFAEAEQVVEASRRDPVTKIPVEFVMIGRVFGLLGGMFQHYKPSIDWQKRVLPHILRSVAS